jgi:uncharacterized membrane protein YdbT with pleckstrin-like domain
MLLISVFPGAEIIAASHCTWLLVIFFLMLKFFGFQVAKQSEN